MSKKILVVQTVEFGAMAAYGTKKYAWQYALDLQPDPLSGSYEELCAAGATTLRNIDGDEVEIVTILLEGKYIKPKDLEHGQDTNSKL